MNMLNTQVYVYPCFAWSNLQLINQEVEIKNVEDVNTNNEKLNPLIFNSSHGMI